MRSAARHHHRRRLTLLALCGGALVVLLVCAAGASADSSDPTSISCSLAVTSTASGQPAVSPISSGSDLTLTATVTSTDGPLGGGTVTFLSDGLEMGYYDETGWNPKTGTAVLKTQSLPPGDHVLTATWESNDQVTFCTTPDVALSVSEETRLKSTTTLSLSPSTFSSSSDKITFTATVSQVGASVARPGGQVLFRIVDANGATGAQFATAELQPDGTATTKPTGGFTPGRYVFEADYTGDINYAPSSGQATLTSDATSVLAYTGPAGTTVGTPTDLTAKLTDAYGGRIGDARVTISIRGTSAGCTTATNTVGVATCPGVIFQSAGSSTVDVSWSGDSSYQGTTATGTLAVGKGATSLTVPDALGSSGSAATLSAVLLDAGGQPLGGQAVTLTVDGNESCGGTTAPNGSVTCATKTPLSETGGNYPLTASFAGSADYLGTAASGTIAVLTSVPAATVSIAHVDPVRYGGSVTITATLKVGVSGLENAPLILRFGEQWCPAQTNSEGIASCTIDPVTAPAGDVPVTAHFEGDHRASEAAATGTAIVYDFAPGGGFFAIGAPAPHVGSAVMFWGAQWAKRNPIGAPPSFKGFVDAATMPTCHAIWTTRPGNSTPPPTGPLPAYMAVVVSSSIAKHGSAISGDVERIVIVATDPGYASDPGHAGTGTAVASLCG